MRIVLGLGLAALASCTTPLDTSDVEQGIVGGQLAQSSDFPTVVALESGAGNWFCTGTLIAPGWILTAAHCVEGETAAGLDIRFDDTDVNDTAGGKSIMVKAIHANPGYDGVAWDNDIALIELAEQVTDRPVTPIHRPTAPPSTAVLQVGYGDADDNGGGAGLLRKLTTTSIDCATVGDATISSANVVCFDQRDGNGTCYGDSGGPSFVDVGGKLEVAAITSGGTVESCLDGYDIQTAVASELEFVDSTMMGAGNDPEPQPMPGDDGDPETKSGDGGGCSAAGGSASSLVSLGVALGVALVARRRKRHIWTQAAGRE